MAPGIWTAVFVTVFAFGFNFIMADELSSLKAVAKSNTDFTSAFYQELAKTSSGNLIFSPVSLSSVMAMVKAGARGTTAEKVRAAMRFPSSDDVLNEGYQALFKELKSGDGSFTLETVNKIYTQKGFSIKPEFTSTLQKYYGAEATQLDFSKSDASAQTINDFVSTTTKNKIKNLISASDLSALTRLVLVNAIYFKGMWKTQFKPEQTREADFYLNAREKVKVQMMRMEAEFPYADIEELDAKAVSLPYKGDRLSMIILLPNKVEGLKDLESRLANFSLSSIPSLLRERKINLAMPKFTLESTIDLKDPLEKLGAGEIFDQAKADFSGIPAEKEQLYVSKAVQKAFIEVNEEGSEAAAATGVQIQLKSAFDGPRFQADYPFVAMISDNTTSLLFQLTYSDPSQSETRLMSSSLETGDVKTGSGSSAVSTWLPSFVIVPVLTSLLVKW